MTYMGSKTASAGGEQRKIAYCPQKCVPSWDAFLLFRNKRGFFAPDNKGSNNPSITEVKESTEAVKAPDTKASPAKEPPKGVKITQMFSDRLDKPEDKALKAIPIPKEGEGYSLRLHPNYFFEFLDHPFTVNREVDGYKELFDSIKANGFNEPVKTRPREGGGLELLSAIDGMILPNSSIALFPLYSVYQREHISSNGFPGAAAYMKFLNACQAEKLPL